MGITMENGPKAPKDPEKKRSQIYLMADTMVESVLRPDGRFYEIVYLEGRVEAKVKVICDKLPDDIAQALPDAQRFRRLVHSIGVTVTAQDPDKTGEAVTFSLQNYGKTDKYSSGSTHSVTGRCNGAQMILPVWQWEEALDDDILGTIYFYFDKADIQAKASVVFYLNDGYTAPEPVIDPPVDFTSAKYKAMLEHGVRSVGNTVRLNRVFAKAAAGETITVAFIGGSITQGAGAKPQLTKSYAYRTYEGLKAMLHTDKIELIKAGVGGTSSEFGVVRFDRDVLRDGERKPDLVFVEYAVNDEGDETKGVCYESLVRKILRLEWAPAVVLVFAVFMNDWNLEDRLGPVGEGYDLPMVSIKTAVVPTFSDPKQTVITKRQFFYDLYHPGNDGHRIMADCILTLLQKVYDEQLFTNVEQLGADPYTKAALSKLCVIGTDFEQLIRVDANEATFRGIEHYIDPGCFTQRDFDVPGAEFDFCATASPMFCDNWMHEAQPKPSRSGAGTKAAEETGDFILCLSCAKLIVVYKDSGDSIVGSADVYVDGTFIRNLDPHEVGWLHCNTAVVLNDLSNESHEIRIRMHEGCFDKNFTILGFGIVL